MVKYCETCKEKKAFIVRPKTGKLICQECFYTAFEEEIHYTIISNNLFKRVIHHLLLEINDLIQFKG